MCVHFTHVSYGAVLDLDHNWPNFVEIFHTLANCVSMTVELPPRATSAFEKALRGILRPMVRAMMSNGITAPAFYRIVKQVYVDVSAETLGEQATDSRVSVMTGVHRRDVKEFRALSDPNAADVRRKVSILSTVVGRWLAGEDTLDPSGSPIPLPRSGDTGITFETLVKSVSRDIRPRTVMDELIRQGIATLKDDMVHLSVDALVGPADLDQRVLFFAQNVGDHMNAAVQNLLGEEPPNLERAVFYNHLSDQSVSLIETEARRLSNEALLSINKTAKALQDTDIAAKSGTNRFRFGVFFLRAEEGTGTEGKDDDDSA
jgi:hypothetical protein